MTTLTSLRILALGISLATAAGQEPLNETIRSIITPIDSPESLSELVSLSSVVIVATCLTEMPGRRFVAGNEQSEVVTDRIVRVDQVLKGQVSPLMQIAVEEPGGLLRHGNRTVKRTVDHQNPIHAGGRYLLFLHTSHQPVGDRFDGNRYVVTGVWAGSFQIVDGRVRASEGDEPAIRALDGSSEAALIVAVQNAIGAAAGRG